MAKKRRRSSSKGRQRRMDESAIRDVRTWFERMLTNAHSALRLASQMSVEECKESNDLFWALAKYAENVQESITQLDSINSKILPRLIEIPVEPEAEGEPAWADLKGMRIRLAHKFWSIDPAVLWATVTRDFPQLITLLSNIRLLPQPIGKQQQFKVPVSREELLSLPTSEGWHRPAPGQAILFLWFDDDGDPQVFRMGVKGPKQLIASASTSMSILGVYGVKCGPEGNEDVTQIGPAVEVGPRPSPINRPSGKA